MMMPFRIFDRDKKEFWIVLNYEVIDVKSGKGRYLIAREDGTTENDGQLTYITSEEILSYRFIEFLSEGES